MLKIRLLRMGRRHRPFYRIVVVNSKRKRDTGAYLAVLGTYDPLAPKGEKVQLDTQAYERWIEKGAQPSEAVLRLVLPVEEKKKRWPDKGKSKSDSLDAAQTEGDSDDSAQSGTSEGESTAEG